MNYLPLITVIMNYVPLITVIDQQFTLSGELHVSTSDHWYCPTINPALNTAIDELPVFLYPILLISLTISLAQYIFH